jgi:hypothetical protein
MIEYAVRRMRLRVEHHNEQVRDLRRRIRTLTDEAASPRRANLRTKR